MAVARDSFVSKLIVDAFLGSRIMGQRMTAEGSMKAKSGLKHYFREIHRFAMLEPKEEYALSKGWREYGDREAAHKLLESHLSLVARIAMGYRGYGLPIADLISEGNIGLMRAINRFEADKGFRLATYATWWIRVAIHEYLLRSLSLVKMGSTVAQRKIFFNLQKAKRQISVLDDGDMRSEQVDLISRRLGVTQANVIDMNRRLAGDVSLNVSTREGNNSDEWQDRLVDEHADQETILAASEEFNNRHKALATALCTLSNRERRIFVARRLVEKPIALRDLADEFGISRERVRQIGLCAYEKLQKAVKQTVSVMETPAHPRVH
jgi:RNA polymerase sigma-32 factor